MTDPARQLKRFLAPHYALHDHWWCWLLARTGAEGWRRVAVQLYHYMGIANHLLRTALEESARCGSGLGPFEAWARAHAEEEAAHPAWLLEDLVEAGCRREDVLASQPDEELRALARDQLALIRAEHPTAVLGLYFATECHPPDAEAQRRTARWLGLPNKALRTLVHHSQVDQAHGEEIFQLVSTYGGTPERFRTIAHGALQSIDSWIQLLQRYLAEASVGPTSASRPCRLKPPSSTARPGPGEDRQPDSPCSASTRS